MSLKGNAEGSFEVRGKITTLDHLMITAYGVAVQNGFDGTEQEWLDSLDGTKVPKEKLTEAVADYFVENPVEDGLPGHDGTTFYPSVDSEGNLSWTNDGNKANPQTVNIKGETGPAGPAGKDGETGEAGPAGPAGKDGYTPVKGVDYYTEAEKQALIAEVINALPTGDEVSY